MEILKIEKNVPIRQKRIHSEIMDTMRAMDIGDSFVVDLNRRTSIGAYGKRAGIKVAIRKETDGFVRVWRTE